MNELLAKLFALFVDSVILMYLDFVNKTCPNCADIMENDVLRNLTYLSLGLLLLNFVAEEKLRNFLSSHKILLSVLGILGLVKLVALFRFITAMRTEECNKCTSHWRRRFLFYYSRGVALMYGLMVLSMVYMALMTPKKK